MIWIVRLCFRAEVEYCTNKKGDCSFFMSKLKRDCLSSLFFYLSTGSYHPLLQGIHLSILHIHLNEPTIAPDFSIDSIIYWLHVGTCLQYGTRSRAQKLWSGERYLWYCFTRYIRKFFIKGLFNYSIFMFDIHYVSTMLTMTRIFIMTL